jgi:hypothetical protein
MNFAGLTGATGNAPYKLGDLAMVRWTVAGSPNLSAMTRADRVEPHQRGCEAQIRSQRPTVQSCKLTQINSNFETQIFLRLDLPFTLQLVAPN